MSTATQSTQARKGAAAPALNQLSARLLGNPLVPLLVVGAAAIALVTALLLWASAPEYRVLYSNLSEADGGRIITELDSRAVPYQFSQGGHTLLVPADQVDKLRLQLAEQGLPEGGNSGFEIMDQQAFGISQFAEQVNFQRGLQGELASSIESIGAVARARVHLAMAKPSVFIRDREPAKASVVLTLEPGRTLGEGQVNAIVHLVSSSVPELAMENVTVVDQAGRLLSQPGEGGNLDGTRLDYVRKVEQRYRQRIESILEPIVGHGNVRAQVVAQVDFDHREETSEHYTPNQDGRPAAVRSTRHNTSVDGDSALAGGIPGALSNTPPGSAPSPIAQTDDKNKGRPKPESSPPNDSGHVHRDDLINYELDHDIIHVQHQRGAIERLSVAVVVNYREVADKNGTLKPTPLSAEELQRIEQLARQAMGFSDARGDGLEVVNNPFSTAAPQDDIEDPLWWQTPFWQHFLLSLMRYLLAGIGALLLFLWVLRPLLQRYLRQPPQPAPARPVAVASATAPTDGDDNGTANEAVGGDYSDEAEAPPRRRRRSTVHEQNLKDLQDMAREDPSLVAMIVRSWMNRND